MRTFEQLTTTERERAIKVSLGWLVDGLIGGLIEIKLTQPFAQECLEQIITEAQSNREPRLGKLRVLSNKQITREIRKLALVDASESVYDQNGDRILKEILQ